MASGAGMLDAVLTLLLNNAAAAAAVVLLIAAGITLFSVRNKKTPIKGMCIAVIFCCIIYLALILMLVIGFGSSGHHPAAAPV